MKEFLEGVGIVALVVGSATALGLYFDYYRKASYNVRKLMIGWVLMATLAIGVGFEIYGLFRTPAPMALEFYMRSPASPVSSGYQYVCGGPTNGPGECRENVPYVGGGR